jgi:hypothetical protein
LGLATGYYFAKHVTWPGFVYGSGLSTPEDLGFVEEAGWTFAYVLGVSGVMTGQAVATSMGYSGPPPMQVATLMFDSAWLGMKIGEATKDTGMAQWFRKTELAESIRSLPF